MKKFTLSEFLIIFFLIIMVPKGGLSLIGLNGIIALIIGIFLSLANRIPKLSNKVKGVAISDIVTFLLIILWFITFEDEQATGLTYKAAGILLVWIVSFLTRVVKKENNEPK
ncbi:hypothetical protein [Alkaliphilus metalliredigens]|uniref:hypothetical protein n=1 Tax=Alkaliphilus metalliredigens TaxID=208226 RepID=UPI0005A2CEBF|nr:hypothetical protein [Alkaliphilus metalliredigens]